MSIWISSGKINNNSPKYFTDHILSKMDDGKVTGVIFLDLKKAFDTVNHKLLIRKLKNLGVSRKSLAWFNSYLIGRTQQVVCGDAVSSKVRLPIGVPQGSILRPLLFLIHIDGVESVLQFSRMTMCADDMAFYCSDTIPVITYNPT